MNPFPDWLTEVQQDHIVIEATPAGLETEAQKNLWTFALTEQQAQELRPEEVFHFLQAVISAREQQLVERFGNQHPMVFYCWFDEQASQLRFSLVSASHHRLPFRGRVNVVVDLGPIVEQFLASSCPSGIPIEQFAEELGPLASASETGVSVWAKEIPVARPNQSAT